MRNFTNLFLRKLIVMAWIFVGGDFSSAAWANENNPSLAVDCAAVAMDQVVPAHALDICLAIATVDQLVVAVAAMKHHRDPETSVGAAKFITNEFQARCALKAMDQWVVEGAVPACLPIQTGDQADVAIAAMDHHMTPDASASEAAKIVDRVQAQCAIMAMHHVWPTAAVKACVETIK